MSSEEKVSDLMETKLQTARADSTAKESAVQMAKSKRGYVIVTDGGQAVGIVTERDLVQKVIAEGLDPAKVLIGDIMSTPLIKVDKDSKVDEAAALMSEYGIRKVVVEDESGKLTGIMTAETLAKTMAKSSNYSDPRLNAMANLKPDEVGAMGGPYQ